MIIPSDVLAAVERMSTPLDASWLAGETAKADARSMATIKSFIDSLAAAPVAPAPQAAVLDWRTILNAELATQEQHYGEVAAAASTGNRLYAGERDMTEGVIKGIEYCIAALASAAPAKVLADLTDAQKAAPELLAALQEMVIEYRLLLKDSLEKQHWQFVDDSVVLRTATAAIAIATGSQA